MDKRLRYIFSTFLVISLFGCGGGKYYRMGQELARIVQFEAGSSWVYENTSTLARDTVVVASGGAYWDDFPGVVGTKAEGKEFAEQVSARYSSTLRDGFFSLESGETEDLEYYVEWTFQPDSLFGSGQTGPTDIRLNYLMSSQNWAPGIERLDSLDLNGTLYTELVKESILSDQLWFGHEVTRYYAADVGLVRLEDRTLNQNWDLISHSVFPSELERN